jgi:hypothetical protein
MLPKDWLKQFEDIPEFTWEDSMIMYNTIYELYELAREMANEADPQGSHYALRIIETMVEQMNPTNTGEPPGATREKKEN